QLDAVVDRARAKALGVPLTELFDTLQTYLGSAYVNDFNQFGRTWQVIAQADARFRSDVDDIARLRTRNDRGAMVPIGAMVDIRETYGPDPVLRYNGYPAADLAGESDPRVLSSTQAMDRLQELADAVLPAGMAIEWARSEEHTSELQSRENLVCRPLLEKKNNGRSGPEWARKRLSGVRRQPGQSFNTSGRIPGAAPERTDRRAHCTPAQPALADRDSERA